MNKIETAAPPFLLRITALPTGQVMVENPGNVNLANFAGDLEFGARMAQHEAAKSGGIVAANGMRVPGA